MDITETKEDIATLNIRHYLNITAAKQLRTQLKTSRRNNAKLSVYEGSLIREGSVKQQKRNKINKIS